MPNDYFEDSNNLNFDSNFLAAIELDPEDSDIDNESDEEIEFVLDKIPGAPHAAEELISGIDDNNENIEVDSIDNDKNIWKWEPVSFLDWLSTMFSNVPKHSGYDSTGLERAISYFEALDREITKAMRTDFKNEIDAAKAEKAREQIEEGLERLVERLEQVKSEKFKRKKKSWAEETGLVKEAQKAVNITGISITVPLFISSLARVCLNGMISAGHDIEDMFHKLSKEYSLDKREQMELCQLLEDMGYAMRRDRGYPVGEPVEIWKNDNFDWAAQYRG